MHKIILAIAIASTAHLAGCGGGGSSSSPTRNDNGETTIGGSAVKGPMANAIVTAYAFDASQPGFKGSEISSGSTDSAAQITGLTIPLGQSTPFLLEITTDSDTTDITTGATPVITTLRTAVTNSMLDGGEPVYATPLTTMAVDMAVANADNNDGFYAGDNSGSVSEAEFTAALTVAAAQVSATLGFGMSDSVDIYTTPPLVNDSTDSDSDLEQIAAYRTAIEALTAVVVALEDEVKTSNPSSAVSTDDLLDALAKDLSDGEIDGQISGQPIAEVSGVADVAAVVTVDPSTLIIPGTSISVADVEQVLVSETSTTGTTADTTSLGNGVVSVEPAPAKVIIDIDGDTVADTSDNCPTVSNTSQQDTDSDLSGDACDTDDDGDGTADDDDAFPLDDSETVDTDGDGTGNNADTDDDGDGTADVSDAFPLDDSETVDTDGDGTGNNADTDDDGDGTADVSDSFPLDDTETADADNDGTGNNADDGDTVADDDDNCPLVANFDQADIDSNGVGDICEGLQTGIFNTTKWGDGSKFK